MGDLRTSIILDLAGNLAARARQFAGGLGRLGRDGSRSMQLLSRSVAATSRGLDRLGNRYTALIGGAAGVGAARMVANLEERFTRLGIQANRGAGEIDELKRQIYEAAQAPDIRVDPGQITSAIEQIVEKTGDLDFARGNIRNIGLALQATGADGEAIGGILAEFQKMGMGSKAAFEALDILTVQGKEGAFTLQNLAALGPRVVTAYTAMGRTGVPAIREMGAALQVIRQGTGSSEMAATALEALLRTLGDADKAKLLQQGGIQIFEPGSTTVMRSLPTLMEEIIAKTGGSKLALSQVFDAEAIRAFNAAASEFQRSGKIESLQKFYNVQADGNTITRDSARAAQTANASLQSLYTAWQKFADAQLSGPIQSLADTLNGLEAGTIDRWFKVAGAVAAVGAAAIVAGKLAQAGSRVRDLVRGGKGGAAGGLGGGKFGDAIPVYVVNGAASVFNPEAGGLPGKAGKASKAGRVMGALGKAGAVLGAGVAGYEVGGLINQGLGGISGMFTGGKYKGEGWMGEMLYDALHREQKPAEVGGTLKIEIEGAPVRVKQMQTKGGMGIDVDSGRVMVGG
ncbi:MAG: hypothetical protein A2Y38_07755 [Spirochaetes bacterium GWB1_59_5]|nr:MAG: hypothetical protein A2Y38_07755 [Spirochaetes bacterium GWB1_59_5]